MGLDVVILAAGKGERMCSRIPKVLHKIMGKPMIDYVLKRAISLKPERVIVVVGDRGEEVREHLKEYGVLIGIQEEQKGTAHAVLSVQDLIKGEEILILYGDVPLIREESLKGLLSFYEKEKVPTFAVTELSEPKGYGRVKMEGERILRIVEEADLDGSERDLKIVNTGICVFQKSHLSLLKEIENKNRKGEYYLTDLPIVCEKKGIKVRGFFLKDQNEALGINTKEDLLSVNLIMKEMILKRHLQNGVIFLDKNVYIEEDVTIGADTIIYPNTYLMGKTEIEEEVFIGPDVTIRDSKIKRKVKIERFSFIDGAEIEENVVIGPFSRIRPKSHLKGNVRIGNFVEVKNSIIEENVKVNHLAYIGDAEIGRNVNIGAGTITCNFDGQRKHKTIIEENVFVGSNVELIAPIRIGKNAIIGAGSTIRKNVPENALAVTRVPQRHIKDYRSKKKCVE